MGYVKKGFLMAIGACVGRALVAASASVLHDILYDKCDWYKKNCDESHAS